MRLNVATWNIWGRAGDFRRRQRDVLSALGSVSADVVALVEVWREGAEEQIHQIGQALDYPYRAYADLMTHDGVSWGVGVLSRLPIVDEVRLEFPNPRMSQAFGGTEASGVALVTTLEHEAGVFDFVCICEWGLSWSGYGASCTSDRVPSYQQLAQILADRQRAIAPIVAGDFNSVPDNRDIRALTGKEPQLGFAMSFLDAWELANGVHGGWTFDGMTNPYIRNRPFGRHRIDYVMLGAGHHFQHLWRVNSARVFGESGSAGDPPSDHYGVQADLELVRLFPGRGDEPAAARDGETRVRQEGATVAVSPEGHA